MIHINTGDGKGKTTAAMGLAMRAINAGQRVIIIQFLKGRESGEITLLKKYENVEILRGKKGLKFSFQMNDDEKAEVKQAHDAQLVDAIQRVREGRVDTLILDEVFGALSTGLLDEKLVLELVDELPASVELVMTGRNASEIFIEKADYVTDMQCVKHPFNQGVKMRKGVEY